MARDIAYGFSSFIYLPKIYQLVLQMTDLSMFKAGTNGVIVVVDLLFYVHSNHLRSCRDGQLT